jgi:hypothetical protein
MSHGPFRAVYLVLRLQMALPLVIALLTAYNDPANAQQTLAGAFQTQNGHYLTAVKGGGLGGPNSGPGESALYTNSTNAGLWETFTIVWVNKAQCKFALKTANNNFVTAVNGGGIGGPNSGQSPVLSDATTVGLSEHFTITLEADNAHVTVRTSDGRHFLTAVNGGGIGGSNNVPIHTDTDSMGAWEEFGLIPPDCAAPRPNGVITRGEFAVLIQQEFGLAQPTKPVVFPDVHQGDAFYSAVQASAPFMNEQILCPGCFLNRNFFPNEPVSNALSTITLVRILIARKEMALVSISSSEDILRKYPDAKSLPAPSRPYFATAIKNELIQTRDTIQPRSWRTKADVSAQIESIRKQFKIPAPAGP